MKDDAHIDELLNSYLDGELSPREQTEVKRLAAHDSGVADRLQQLQKCKVLLSSLPSVEAPGQLFDNINAELEKRRLPERIARQGTIHLMLRKFTAAAAMIILAGALGVIIFSIVIPKQAPKKAVIVGEFKQKRDIIAPVVPQPENKMLAVETRGLPKQPDLAAEKKALPKVLPVEAEAAVFAARLELKTRGVPDAATAVNKLLEKHPGIEFVGLPSEPGRAIYSIDCPARQVSLFLLDMEGIWDQFNSATLFVEDNSTQKAVVVSDVKAWQLAQVFSLANSEKRIKAAGYYAILNNLGSYRAEREQDNIASGSLKEIPQPVLTGEAGSSGDKPDSNEKIHLIIAINSD